MGDGGLHPAPQAPEKPQGLGQPEATSPVPSTCLGLGHTAQVKDSIVHRAVLTADSSCWSGVPGHPASDQLATNPEVSTTPSQSIIH